jgi:DnaJ homologue, subfamily C, member 28, conserved domain
MTERKPPGLGWERWIDRQLREATERGEFENLPGAGKPIPGLDKPSDEMWWVKGKLRSEGLSYQPPSLALRKEAQDVLKAVSQAGSEAEARELIEDINRRIREANKKGIAGPPIMLVPFDVERVLTEWREQRHQDGRSSEPGPISCLAASRILFRTGRSTTFIDLIPDGPALEGDQPQSGRVGTPRSGSYAGGG